MGTFRMARIDKQLQREISLLLRERIKNASVKDAIITGVECSRDLERAKVFFTAIDPQRRPALLDELRGVKGALRTLLGRAMRLRHVPALEFVADDSADRGARIDDILDRLALDAMPHTEEAPTDKTDEEDRGADDRPFHG